MAINSLAYAYNRNVNKKAPKTNYLHTIRLVSGWNYVSFPFHVKNNTTNILLPLSRYPNLDKIQGESVSHQNISGSWAGSIPNLLKDKGYQIYNKGKVTYNVEIKGGTVWGDDLKYTTTNESSLLAIPYRDDRYFSKIQGFSDNRSVLLADDSTGTLLSVIKGRNSITPKQPASPLKPFDQEGVDDVVLGYGAYWFVHNQLPKTQPFAYFKGIGPRVKDWDGTEHPMTGANKRFWFHAGDITKHWFFINSINLSGNTAPIGIYYDDLTTPFTADQDYIGAFRGETCVGMQCIQGSKGKYVTSLPFHGVESNATVTTDGSWSNCRSGDTVRPVIWSKSKQKYYITKFYNTSTSKYIEWDSTTFTTLMVADANSNTVGFGSTSGNYMIPATIKLIALDPLTNDW